MYNKINIFLIYALMVTACGKNNDQATQESVNKEQSLQSFNVDEMIMRPQEVLQNEAAFPYFTVDQIILLNKNERDELERRCLGLHNKTCTNFKSEEFLKKDEQYRALCESSRNVYQAAEDFKRSYNKLLGVNLPKHEIRNVKGCEPYY